MNRNEFICVRAPISGNAIGRRRATPIEKTGTPRIWKGPPRKTKKGAMAVREPQEFDLLQDLQLTGLAGGVTHETGAIYVEKCGNIKGALDRQPALDSNTRKRTRRSS